MSAVVNGIAPDAPTTTNANGGKQSHTPYRCDLLPPLATLAVAEVLASGAAKYGANNWHAITVEEHLNHAMGHQLAYLAGDTQDDHLEHAACRLLMALEQRRTGRLRPPKLRETPELLADRISQYCLEFMHRTGKSPNGRSGHIHVATRLLETGLGA